MDTEYNFNENCQCVKIFNKHHTIIYNNNDSDMLKIGQKITNFPPCFLNFYWIKTIICSFNNISDLNVLPPNLEFLECNNNKIKTINIKVFPRSLRKLNLNNNNISELNLDGTNIEHLCIERNELKFLRCSKKINKLNISGNYNINVDFNGVDYFESIDVSSCNISSLNNYPKNIKNLNVHSNMLDFFDYNFSKLEKLNCSNNKIKKIENLPKSLKSLIISSNLLEELIITSNEIKEIYCSSNKLCKLEITSESLNTLVCHNNPLKIIRNNSNSVIEYGELLINENLVILPLCLINDFYKIYGDKHKTEIDNLYNNSKKDGINLKNNENLTIINYDDINDKILISI